MDKAKKLTCPRRFDIFFALLSVPLRFKPPGNKAKPGCQRWVESATVQGRGRPSDVKEGLSSCFVLPHFCGPFNVTVFRSMEGAEGGKKNGRPDKGELMFDMLTHVPTHVKKKVEKKESFPQQPGSSRM